MTIAAVSTFRHFDILKDVDDDALQDLARRCSWALAPAGKPIIFANESTTEVYFLTSGKARVLLYAAEDGRPVVFTTIGRYEIFGEISSIDGLPRSATVEAEEDCKLAVLSQEKFRGLIKDHHSFALAILKLFAMRVRRLSDLVYEFSTMDVPRRLAAELLRWSEPLEDKAGQALISPAPRARMAARIGTSREQVSRALGVLEDIGMIRREGISDVRIPDMERLRRFVGGPKGE